MKHLIFICCLLMIMIVYPTYAKSLDYDVNSKIRALYGYNFPADTFKTNQKRNHMPLYADIEGEISYKTDDVEIGLFGTLKSKLSNNLENLNQGHWGEEVYFSVFLGFGDFYVGQMPNVAAMNAVTKSNISVWQPNNDEIVDFINNPNWYQTNKTKYYSTLVSTNPNTDGSSLKIAYFTPEYKSSSIGISYTPNNNANDSLISKFTPYYNKSSYSISFYNHQEFDFFDTEFYMSFSDYEKSHSEYATGFSLYRKGWTFLASYLKSETKRSDKPINTITLSKNKKAYFDDFRDSTAYNFAVSYEFAFLTSTLSYFDSFSKNTKASNRIINLHNSLKFDKSYSIYLGVAYAQFKNAEYDMKGNKGLAIYTGIQFDF